MIDPDASPQPWGPPPPPPSPRARIPLGRELAVGGGVTAVLAVLGVPVGFLWEHLAPHATLVAQGHDVFVTSANPKAMVGADGYFLAIGVVVGLLCGIASVIPGRKYGVGIAAALAIGGLLGAWIAWHVGTASSGGISEAALARRPDGTTARTSLSLHATGVLFAWPLVSLAVFLVGLLFQPLPHETQVRDGDDTWPFMHETS